MAGAEAAEAGEASLPWALRTQDDTAGRQGAALSYAFSAPSLGHVENGG